MLLPACHHSPSSVALARLLILPRARLPTLATLSSRTSALSHPAHREVTFARAYPAVLRRHSHHSRHHASHSSHSSRARETWCASARAGRTPCAIARARASTRRERTRGVRRARFAVARRAAVRRASRSVARSPTAHARRTTRTEKIYGLQYEPYVREFTHTTHAARLGARAHRAAPHVSARCLTPTHARDQPRPYRRRRRRRRIGTTPWTPSSATSFASWAASGRAAWLARSPSNPLARARRRNRRA